MDGDANLDGDARRRGHWGPADEPEDLDDDEIMALFSAALMDMPRSAAVNLRKRVNELGREQALTELVGQMKSSPMGPGMPEPLLREICAAMVAKAMGGRHAKVRRRPAAEFLLMRDPFTVLGVADDAGDAEIRRRYLALVRDFPPDRAPERFQELRAAYEALSDERKRLATKLLHTNSAALSRLSMDALRGRSRDGPPARATRQTVDGPARRGDRAGLAGAKPAANGDDGRQRGR